MDNPAEHLVALTTVPSDIEASIIVAALREAGMHVVATGGATAGFKAGAPGVVKVLVNEYDLQVARNTLEELKASDAEIDWSQVDTGTPEA
ncbi:hypothetical protein Pla175_49440 [Pirellulimonas nuda]|uniref:DUF2007 domain-containing protein n=1 Tax=Pirellulimonas nuda TaxID=2528009 RepID=A0A518DJ65_9BACT|nr:DUF2007 domain-containing protein [Pirellulimonas nuda]QDU91515.1 hypothetical protein Pla175_49440 [Pirellulimonas nuda]